MRNEIYYVSAETYDLCIEKIRSLHGRNYQILRKRTVKLGGFLGLFQKDGVEIAYVVPPEPIIKNYSQQIFQKIQNIPVHNSIMGESTETLSHSNTEKVFEEERKKILTENKVGNDTQLQGIRDEIREMKVSLDYFKNITNNTEEDHLTITRIKNMLENNEFTPSFIRKIILKIRNEFSLEKLEDFESVQTQVIDWIGESIKITGTGLKTRPQVIILVGPTGVGKTTTVAKIAAMYVCPSSPKRLNVRIITIDAFRIAAKEQIKTYGDIMEIPVSCAENPDDFQKLLSMYGSDVDVILVDTIGYSPKDYENIGRMRKLLELHGASTEVFLTMTASTKASDMRDIIQQFEIFGYRSIIVTKLDETSCIGNLVSVLDEKAKAIAFLTTGQKVSKDIEKASVVKLLMQLSEFKINREHIEEKFPCVE